MLRSVPPGRAPAVVGCAENQKLPKINARVTRTQAGVGRIAMRPGNRHRVPAILLGFKCRRLPCDKPHVLNPLPLARKSLYAVDPRQIIFRQRHQYLPALIAEITIIDRKTRNKRNAIYGVFRLIS